MGAFASLRLGALAAWVVFACPSGSRANNLVPTASAKKVQVAPDRRERTITVPAGKVQLRPFAAFLGGMLGLPLIERTLDEVPNQAEDRPGIVIQRGLEKRQLVLGLRGVPGAEVMDALGVALNAEWVRVGPVSVLTDTPEIALLAALPLNVITERNTREVRPLKSLDRRQIGLLMQRGELRPEDLSPAQQQALRATAGWAYVYCDGEIAPEALQLRGVSIRLAKNSLTTPGAPPYELRLTFPGANGHEVTPVRLGHDGRESVPDGPANNAERPFGMPTTRLVTSAKKADLSADPKLDAEMKPVEGTLAQAAQMVAESAEINLVMSSLLSERSLRLQPLKRTAREVLAEIARVTGGDWYRVGSTYVLHPNARVERAMRLDDEPRRAWLIQGIGEVQKRMGTSQRRLLQERGRLTPTQLTSAQQDMLRWVVALAYAAHREVSPDALTLKKVSLTYAKPDGSGNASTHTAHYCVPLASGALLDIGSAPLQ